MNADVQTSERARAEALGEPLIGSVIAGRYRIDAVLGEGTAGRLYRAAQLPLERLVALRVLPAGRPGREADERFAREASIAAKLTHPNSVRLIDFGRTADGAPFVAMEHLAGRTLADVLAEGPLHEIRALHLVQQICRSVREAHAMQILHRGLRPSSIMLLRQQDEPDFVKVMDFGMPRASSMAELARMPTAAANYLAPELARNQPLDVRCDIYAVGAVLYEMLTGRAPFVGTSATDVIVRHLAEQPLPPRAARPDLQISPTLERIVLRCLAKDRAARYGSMDELLLALKQARDQLGRARAQADTLPPPIARTAPPPRVIEVDPIATPQQIAGAAEATPAMGTPQSLPLVASARTAPRFESFASSSRSGYARVAMIALGAALAVAALVAVLRDPPPIGAATAKVSGGAANREAR